MTEESISSIQSCENNKPGGELNDVIHASLLEESLDNKNLSYEYSGLDKNKDIYQIEFHEKSKLTIHCLGHSGKVKGAVDSNDCRISLRSRHRVENDHELFTCSVCEKAFKEKRTFEDHSCKDIPKNLFTCDVCQKTFSKKRALECHNRIHTRTEKLSVEKSMCKTEAASQAYFDVEQSELNGKHSSTPTGEERFVCEICKRVFSGRRSLNRHRRMHDGESHVCHLCQKSYTSKYYLASHIQRHSRDKPFLCEICFKSFAQKSDLSCHVKAHGRFKKFVCNICYKGLSTKMSLKSHLQIHAGEKPYVCNICQKAFIKKTGLETHLHSHTGTKPYVCNVCQKAFASKYYLNEHRRIHTVEKPYCCHICPERFNVRFRYNAHLVKHLARPSLFSDACQESLISEGDLNFHVHSEQALKKRFTCELCDKSYNSSPGLREHLRKHTGEKPYVCDICQKAFFTRYGLKRHFLSHSLRGENS